MRKNNETSDDYGTIETYRNQMGESTSPNSSFNGSLFHSDGLLNYRSKEIGYSDEADSLLPNTSEKTTFHCFMLTKLGSSCSIHLIPLFSWYRVKVAIVLLIWLFMLYLFISETEGNEEVFLGATSSSFPMIAYLNFYPPIQVLDLELQAPIVNQPTSLNITVEDLLETEREWQERQELSTIPNGLSLELYANDSWNQKNTMTIDLSEEIETDIQEYVDVFDEEPYRSYRVVILSNSTQPIGINLLMKNFSQAIKLQVLFAALILAGVYCLIVFELVHKAIAAMFGAFVALAILSKIQIRPTFPEVITWIDFETCGLLFGMMIMVGIFSQTGFFEWGAVKAYKFSKGRVWYLVALLCTFTAVVSSFLDNVTTILLVTPITIKLCGVLRVPPEYVVMTTFIFSNIGGTATAIGDPPNVLIANDHRIQQISPITFIEFTMHMLPGVLLSSIPIFFLIRYFIQSKLHREPLLLRRKEVQLWRRTLKTLKKGDSEEEDAVRLKLEDHIKKLEKELAAAAKQHRKDSEIETIDITELENKYQIKDKYQCISSLIILSAVVILFFIHNLVHMNLSLAWIAIIGAITHLIVSGVRDFDEVIAKVDFGTLVFFAGLFILMHALEELELIEFIGEELSSVVERVPEGKARLAAAVTLLLWVSGFMSSIMDNIPYTAALIPVIVRLGDGHLGLPLSPLVYALSFGSCFGGNGTLIGASANVVAVSIAESHGYPIGFNQYLKLGIPVTILSLFIASIYLLLFHVVIPWY